MALVIERWTGTEWVRVAQYARETHGGEFRADARDYARALSLAQGALVHTWSEDTERELDLFDSGKEQTPG